MYKEILKLKHITKKYPGVTALDDVSLSFREGEIHAIAGENGAGKSTFIKTITGAIYPTSGEIYFEDRLLKTNSPEISMQQGIAAIYQEFNLFPSLSVAENIFYGRYPKKNGTIDYNEMLKRTSRIMEELGIDIAADTLVKNLSVGYQQLVEIAKSVSKETKLLIMDEPSAPLTENEVKHLFRIIKNLKKKRVTIIYISHRLEEIFQICDRVSIFRDGKYIKTLNVKETNVDELIRIMVNRNLGEQYPPKNYSKGEKVLEIRNLNTSLLKDINIEAYRGEILGLAGLVGAGRTETVRALFGAEKVDSGDFYLWGKRLKIKSPQDAIKYGIGLIPEDRKKQGLLLKLPVRYNISFANFQGIKGKLGLDLRKDYEISQKYIASLAIKTPSSEQAAGQLSGGNQQKVVLAKWLFKNSDILIFDEPTRGIDVGAKQEIYKLMVDLVERGKVLIMISSDMSELIGMSDRIIIMHEGKITGNLKKEDFTQEKILSFASGVIEMGEETLE
ncbi:MAG: sugar ABC transporter ATP-binding protein [Eubacteriales bacterium]|nr:sugar ABC transporter ATP-binding protein [Eubacteriales bacterium]